MWQGFMQHIQMLAHLNRGKKRLVRLLQSIIGMLYIGMKTVELFQLMK